MGNCVYRHWVGVDRGDILEVIKASSCSSVKETLRLRPQATSEDSQTTSEESLI